MFFLFPFKKSALTVMLIYAIVLSLLPDGKVGIILFILLLFPLAEFLFELMEQVANGEEVSSDNSKLFSTENKGMFLKLLLAFVFFTVLLQKTIEIIGGAVGYPLAAFFIFGLPASFVILTIEKNIFSMVNPSKIIYIIKQFGGAYLLVYLMTIVSVFVSFKLGYQASREDWLAGILFNMFSIYLIVILFSMMGYLVFQHHHELNYKVRLLDVDSLKGSTQDRMSEVDIFIQEGRFEDAQKFLLSRITENPKDYKSNEKLILLYAVQGNQAHMNKIAEQYFSVLLNANKITHAADFFYKLSSRSVDYIPESSEIGLVLAEHMSNSKQYQVALQLLDHFSCAPGADNWDKIGFAKAKLLFEFKHEGEAAIVILDGILKRSLDQELLNAAEEYRTIILS